MSERLPFSAVLPPAGRGGVEVGPAEETAERRAFRRKVVATLFAFGLKFAYAAFTAWLRSRRGGGRGRGVGGACRR